MPIEPIHGNFGVRLTGADARAFSDQDLRDAARLLFDHRVLVIPGQATDIADFVAFGRKWGEPVMLIARKNRREDHPEVIVQSNSDAVPRPVRNVAAHWHCDSSYEAVAATVTMLLGVKAPAEGGETMFADMTAAFDALPPTRQAQLEALQIRHAVSAAKPAADELIVRPQDLPAELNRDTQVLAPVLHPLVRVHPVTGRKALYGLGGSAFAVVGMGTTEGAALIAELKVHATSDRFVSSHKLMPGEIMLWDNFAVMHRATFIDYGDDPAMARLNYRISLKGLPGFMTAG